MVLQQALVCLVFAASFVSSSSGMHLEIVSSWVGAGEKGELDVAFAFETA